MIRILVVRSLSGRERQTDVLEFEAAQAAHRAYRRLTRMGIADLSVFEALQDTLTELSPVALEALAQRERHDRWRRIIGDETAQDMAR